MARTQEQYRQALANSLPQGEAFKAKNNPDTVMYDLLLALAKGWSAVDKRSEDLTNEMFPQTVTESIDEWDIEYGLPSACASGISQTFAERKASLLAKFAGIGGQDKAYYIKIANDLGFDVTITEFNGARYTRDVYTSKQYGQTTHPFVWYINVAGVETIYATYTQDRFTSTQYSKLGIDTTILECLINELKPAHTQVVFNY
jgi:uncharacterized protein YmfQ (DUF2313 family)